MCQEVVYVLTARQFAQRHGLLKPFALASVETEVLCAEPVELNDSLIERIASRIHVHVWLAPRA